MSDTPSARQQFFERLRDLYNAAGRPAVDGVAANVNQTLPLNARKIKAERVREWVSGRSIPQRWELLVPVLRRLGEQAQLANAASSQRRLTDVESWRALWDAAREERGATDADDAVQRRPGGGARLPHRIPLRNPLFTGRADMLATLDMAWANKRSVAITALQGIAGIGKTSLAIEYAHRELHNYDLVWWIDAERPGSINAQLAGLAVAVGLVPRNSDVKWGADEALAWLQQHDDWLLIFDNAEDPSAVAPLLPRGSGRLIITSRRSDWNQVADRQVSVDVFSRDESVSLLQSSVPGISIEDGAKIAALLGDLPLGLSQAAAFIAESRMPCAVYCSELESRTTETLSQGQALGYQRTFAASVNLAIKRISSRDRRAAELLLVYAFLGSDPIPVANLDKEEVRRGQVDDLLSALLADPLAMRQAIRTGIRSGLAKLDAAGNVVIHRLTQRIVQDGLELEQKVHLLKQAERLLASNRPGDPEDPANWAMFALLVPHLSAVIAHRAELGDLAETPEADFRKLIISGFYYLYVRDQSDDAIPLAQAVVAGWSATIGSDHEDTLAIISQIGNAYTNLGRHDEARVLFEGLLATAREKLGLDHRVTRNTANNLGVALLNLERFPESASILRETWEMNVRIDGEESASALRAADNLGSALTGTGDYLEAKAILVPTLSRRLALRGENHQDSLWTKCHLAEALAGLQEYDEAAQIFRETLRKQIELLGPNHFDVRRTRAGLA